MKKIIKLFSVILFLGLSMNLTAKSTVVATTSMIGDMVEVLAGDLVEVEVLVPVGGDPHMYDAIPEDAQLVYTADLIFKNGLNLEGWISELIENSGTKATVVTVTDNVPAIASDDYADSSDPHAWMNPLYGKIYVENIAKALIELLGEEKAATILANKTTYLQELEELDEWIQTQINSIPEARRVLITNHDAFKYYGRKYGLRLESVMGTSTDAAVQTSDIIRVQKVIRAAQVPTIFVETTINPQQIKQIAEDNNVTVGEALYADSLGEEGSDGDTYIKMLKANTKRIVAGLTKEISTDKPEVDTKKSLVLPIVIGLGLLIGFLFFFKKMNRKY